MYSMYAKFIELFYMSEDVEKKFEKLPPSGMILASAMRRWRRKGGRERGRRGGKLTFQAFLEHKDGIQVWKRELFPRGLQIPAASSNIIVNYSHTHTHKQTKPEGIHHGDSVRVLFVHKTNPLQQHCYIT